MGVDVLGANGEDFSIRFGGWDDIVTTASGSRRTSAQRASPTAWTLRRPRSWRTPCKRRERRAPQFVSNITAFAAFLRRSGGFQIA